MNRKSNLTTILNDLIQGQKPILTNALHLSNEQIEIILKKHTENILIADEVEKLDLSNEWTNTITSMFVNRAYISVSTRQKEQIENIATTNSKAVLYLADKGKLVGLSLLEKLSVELDSEAKRLNAVQLILNHGVKESKKYLEIIFNQSISEKTLLDFM